MPLTSWDLPSASSAAVCRSPTSAPPSLRRASGVVSDLAAEDAPEMHELCRCYKRRARFGATETTGSACYADKRSPQSDTIALARIRSC